MPGADDMLESAPRYVVLPQVLRSLSTNPSSPIRSPSLPGTPNRIHDGGSTNKIPPRGRPFLLAASAFVGSRRSRCGYTSPCTDRLSCQTRYPSRISDHSAPLRPDKLASIIHEHFRCNRGFAAADKPSAGRLAACPFNALHEYTSGSHGSACLSRYATPGFRDESS